MVELISMVVCGYISKPILKSLYMGPFDTVQTLSQIHPELQHGYFREQAYEGPNKLTQRLVRENGYSRLLRG